MWAQDDAFGLLRDRRGTHSNSIDRKTLIRRNNPTCHHIGREQFLLGEGSMSFHVDATALQTFVPDSALALNMGVNLTDTTRLTSLNMTLDRWTGKADSRFRYDGHYYHVETVCSPSNNHSRPAFATRVSSDSIFEVVLRPSAVLANTGDNVIKVTSLKQHAAIRLLNTTGQGKPYHWFIMSWRGNASLKVRGNQIVLRCKGTPIVSEGKKKKDFTLDLSIMRTNDMPSDSYFNSDPILPFTDFALKTATGWNTFWTECGIADFSATGAPEARLAEQRLIEALYNITSATPADWWLQTPLTAYGFAKQVVPLFRKSLRNQPEQLWQRPELIAATLLTLRAYTEPQVAERFEMTADEVNRLFTTIINAYSEHVSKSALLLAEGKTTAPDYLDRDRLLAVATAWKAAADSLGNVQQVVPANEEAATADTTVATRSQQTINDAAKGLFRLPTVAELVASPTLTPRRQSLLLLAVAARQWPQQWNVKTEDLLPLP